MQDDRKISLKADEIEAFDEVFIYADDVYETASKHHQTQQLRVWEGQNIYRDPKNSKYYELEKREVITTVNNFMTKLYIESQRLKSNENLPQDQRDDVEDRLMDQIEIGQDLLTRLRNLLTMEKTDAVMDHSLNRTRFFKMDDYNRAQEAEKETNRQIAMAEKREKVKWLGDIIESMTARYNAVVDVINAPGDYKFLDEFKINTTPMELKKNVPRKKRDAKNERDGNKECSILGSPVDILNSRIIEPEVKPTYRIIGTDVTSYKTVYNYSCTLYGLYAEGKGSKKEKAKEDAATEMIRLILNEQTDKTLSNQLKPFNEQEVIELQTIIKGKQNYSEFLEESSKEEIPLENEVKIKDIRLK
ncbi:uncharacterized protein LOC126843213 [Adelges cooleyi]|uniref:uncharacterized protein LOC126843213 n=1 Tax=Adelges cooleyi TaxID=133065 RepID=UPI00217FFCDC|nr:uncharacterized protein LOC126843213 [Adelges cooleyi]